MQNNRYYKYMWIIKDKSKQNTKYILLNVLSGIVVYTAMIFLFPAGGIFCGLMGILAAFAFNVRNYYLTFSMVFYLPFLWVVFNTRETIIGAVIAVFVTGIITVFNRANRRCKKSSENKEHKEYIDEYKEEYEAEQENEKQNAHNRAASFGKAARIIAGIGIILLVIYVAIINGLVSAALEPDFISRFEVYEEITDKGYSEMVYTNDIVTNSRAIGVELKEWYASLDEKQLFKVSKNIGGYRQVAAVFMQREHSDKWALVLHGYTGWKEEMYSYAMWYYKNGYNVVAPDLRNQGESDGDFIGMGWMDHFDCMEWIDYILSENENADIVLHGQSMGAATVLMMTSEKLPSNVKACISDCSYTTAYEMFGDKATEWFGLPAFPFVDSVRVWLILRDGYDLYKASAINAVAESDIPTLFIHGTKDKMIDCDMVYRLYDAENADKDILVVQGAGHVQSRSKNPDVYYGKILEFIAKYL